MSVNCLALIFLVMLLPACTPPISTTEPTNNDVAHDFVPTGTVKISVFPPPPSYPVELKIARIQGEVVVEVTVNSEGVPIKAIAVSGPKELRPIAENYFSHMRYFPRLENEKAIPFRVKNALTFSLK